MGKTCSGVTNACCTKDFNVDIHGQVEGLNTGKLGWQSEKSPLSNSKQAKRLDVDEIMALPKTNARRKTLEKQVNKVIALIRGHLARCRYKKIKFISLLTGKKAHQIRRQEDLHPFPLSMVRIVILKEQEVGPLPLTNEHRQAIIEKRGVLAFKNGYLLSEGQQYTGQWNSQKGCKEGFGLQVWPDGSKYEGFWMDDLAQGYGRFILADGDVYQGGWADDKAHGYGEYLYAEGATYKGGWIGDKQEGKGKEEWPDGSFYDGQYIRGKKHGPGVFQWADGARYEGEWQDNKMHGRGEFKWADGRVYKGEYYNDKKHGRGIYTWVDGRRYEGRFHNGKQHGKGVYRQSNGQEVYGLWEKGRKLVKCENVQEFNALQDNV